MNWIGRTLGTTVECCGTLAMWCDMHMRQTIPRRSRWNRTRNCAGRRRLIGFSYLCHMQCPFAISILETQHPVFHWLLCFLLAQQTMTTYQFTRNARGKLRMCKQIEMRLAERTRLGHRPARYSLVTFTKAFTFRACRQWPTTEKCEMWAAENWRIFRASCGRPRELWARVTWIEYHGPSAWLKSWNQCTLRIIFIFRYTIFVFMFMQFIMFVMRVLRNSSLSLPHAIRAI